MRFGITKNLNSLIFCFCSHLSLSLQNSMNVVTSHRNSNLDWIRCVAILLVITVHTWSLANVSEGAYPLLNGIYDAFVGCGVPLFLMISGGLQLVGESQSLRAFYVKRFKRLLIPFFFWATLIYVLSSCIGKYAEVQSLKKRFDDFENTEFAKEFCYRIEEKIKKMNISDGTKKNLGKAGKYMKDAGTWIVEQAAGKKTASGFVSIFKTSAYSGSKLHDSVLKVGHLFGHKFKPWQAVRWTKNIANSSRILGAIGSVLTVGFQIYNDVQEDKIEKQLAEGRGEIRTCFRDVSNVIEMEYDKVTGAWVQKNIVPCIDQIDSEIEEINNNIQAGNDLYVKLTELLQRVRRMIAEIQAM